jgi:CheY-like chemotaxis protein
VFPADGPRQALELIESQLPLDVVLSDVQMPGMRGTELVRKIAQVKPQTACILMTGGVVDWADVPEGVDVVRKPFSAPDLIVAVNRAIARSVDLKAALQATIQTSAVLQEEARRLQVECDKVIRQAAVAVRRSRLERERRNRNSEP